MQSRYLHRLPTRPAEAEANARSTTRQPIRLAGVVAMVALLSISGVVATAFEGLVANLHNGVLPGWPADGCLNTGLEPLAAQVVARQAILCSAGRTVWATVDLENLEPDVRYIVWIAQFGNRSLCGPGPLLLQVQTPDRLCSLADLGEHADHASVHGVVVTVADAHGVFHVDAPLQAISLAPHSYVWLIVAPPQWSPVPHPGYRSIDADTGTPVARAMFEVP